MHIGTFRLKTFAFGANLLRRGAGVSLFETFSALGSEFLEEEPPVPPRRTCHTGLLRPTWIPGRPGLLGHFLDFDSPAELLREHGALFTFLATGAPANNLGRVPVFPADLLRENGQMLIFSSAAELAPPLPLFLSFFFLFSFSFSSGLLLLLLSVFFFSVFLKMSFHRFDVESVEEAGSVIAGDDDSGSGSGS